MLLGAAVLSAAACSRPTEARPHVVLRFATGTPGGGFYPFGEALAEAYARLMPDVDFHTRPTAGAVDNVTALERGNADLAFAFADVAYIAYVGRLDGAAAPFDHLRGIAALQLTPVHLVVGRDTAIRSPADLRGRRIGVGPPGSGTELTARLVLEASGISTFEVHTEPLPFNDAARRLVGGTLDAMFDNAIFPAESVRMAVRAGARIVPLTGAPFERLRHEYPFLERTVIPRDAYGLGASVHTIGVHSLLVCRQGLDESLVYDLTRRFFDALPTLSSRQAALRSIDLDQAPATPIPLHEGAARYYRERELMR